MRRSFVLALWLAACGATNPVGPSGVDGGSVDGGGSDQGGMIDVDTACTAYATAYCNKEDACIKNGVSANYGTETVCETRLKQSCQAAAAAAGTGVDGKHYSDCAAAHASASCSDFLNNNITACVSVPGSLANGAACAFGSQCVSTYCQRPRNLTCGHCAAVSTAGSDCTVASCAHGFSCQSNGCQAIAYQASASCSATSSCGAGLGCLIAQGSPSGSCIALGASVGAACDTSAASHCDVNKGLYCDHGHCAALTYDQPGATCGVNPIQNSYVVCTNASLCYGATMSHSGSCLAYAQDGAACDTSDGPGCLDAARCVTASSNLTAGTCQLFDASKCM